MSAHDVTLYVIQLAVLEVPTIPFDIVLAYSVYGWIVLEKAGTSISTVSLQVVTTVWDVLIHGDDAMVRLLFRFFAVVLCQWLTRDFYDTLVVNVG